MDAFRSSPNYSIPSYFKDQAQDMKNIEAEANQALLNIKSIYEEIMQPESPEESWIECNSEPTNSLSSTLSSSDRQCKLDPRKFRIKSNFPFHDSQSLITHCSKCHRGSLDDSLLTNSEKTYFVEKQQLNNKQRVYKSNNNITKQNYNFKSDVKITVPQPFSLSGFDQKRLQAKQLKLDKIKNELDRQLEKELNVKVISKPVPKHTYLPLFNEMMKKDERRKLERKEKSLELVGKSSIKSQPNDAVQTLPLPTSNTEVLLERKTNFKASPLPKSILSDKITEKIKNKEEIRKMLIAHRAEEMLKQSSSPLSKKYIQRSYSMLDMNDYKKNSILDKNLKPNIAAITDRLYTKKCRETIDAWNDKVMKSCHQKENDVPTKSILNKKTQPEELYPFLYYPVRMSTASSLRNKQIR